MKAERLGGMAEVVVCLPSKHEANLSTDKGKKKKNPRSLSVFCPYPE
jgi:hypothetical protein